MSQWCKTEAPAQNRSGVCKWRHMPITWAVLEVPAEFSREEYEEIVGNCWDAWAAVCGMTHERIGETNRTANVTFLARRIDGQNGVLAEAQLPCGNVTENTQLWCRVDVGENWANFKGRISQGVMDIYRVLLHEIGHILGISHETTGVRALMDPSVSNIRSLQQWDIQQAVARYGPALSDGESGNGGDSLTPLIECLTNCLDAKTADAVNFGWEAFKRRLKK